MRVNLTVLTVLILFSSSLYAEYDVAELKQLFTSKSQRAQIDAARSGNYSGSEVQTQKIKMSGYLTRSKGKSVVWINNRNTLENAHVDDIKVHHSSIGKNKKVTISIDNKTTRLKPGEVWHKESGKIVDSE